MTKATIELIGCIDECAEHGKVRVANIFFSLPEGESASVGQFIKASLVWDDAHQWVAKDASVFESTADQADKEVAPTIEATPVVTSTAPAPQAAKPQQTPNRIFFGKPSAVTQVAPTPTPVAPPKVEASANAPSKVTPLPSKTLAAAASRFGARGQASTPKLATQAPVAAVSAKPAAPAAPTAPVSRFGSAISSKAATNRQTASRPAFNPEEDFRDSDIPF